jgi:small subunit ribosomal protein S17
MDESQAPAERPARGRRRTLTGHITSDKMDKTVVVAVEVLRKHRLYGRAIRRTHKFKAHDPQNQYHVGDVVEIRENRPLSREKHWVVAKLIKSGHEEIAIVDPTAPPARSAS